MFTEPCTLYMRVNNKRDMLHMMTQGHAAPLNHAPTLRITRFADQALSPFIFSTGAKVNVSNERSHGGEPGDEAITVAFIY